MQAARCIKSTGWSPRQMKLAQESPSVSRWGSPESGHNEASESAGVQPADSVRGRKVCKDASVNALAQRRYHQKLKVMASPVPRFIAQLTHICASTLRWCEAERSFSDNKAANEKARRQLSSPNPESCDQWQMMTAPLFRK